MTNRTLLITVILFSTTNSFCQTGPDRRDSIKVKQTCESFYGWYGSMTVSREIEIFNPQFVRTPDGMTTLDFSTYRKGLKRHNFTEELIEKRIKNFDKCVDNLRSIAYEDYLKFRDLDQFEEISCDFSNQYEFVGGMEWINGGDLTNIEWIDEMTAKATISIYSILHDKKNPHGDRTITLTKEKGKWKISDI